MKGEPIEPEIVGQPRRNFESWKKIIFRVIIPLVVLIVLNTCFVYIKPNQFGIKQVNIGIKTGILPIVYNTGYHFVIPLGFELMHRFPKDIQIFELTNSAGTASENARIEKASHIQTSDGFFVDVDVSIVYRIIDPYKVITTIGPGLLYEDNGIVPKVEPKLKEALGVMTTEEFYNSPLRSARANEAKILLNKELESKGILVEQVLIRYFYYSDEIQRNIEEKKLKDQLVFTNQSKAKASKEQALVQKVTEEGEANIKVKLEEGRAHVTTKTAEKDLYVRTKKAEADLMIKLAEAKKTDLINQAYQKSGSNTLVGLKMAEIYKGLDVIILSSSGKYGLNPLNLNSSLEFFGIDNSIEK
jgi:regulator of protease activity HflC (stomatin/prohibitin superfamily)